VFAHALRGLSGAKITRAKVETYRNHAGDGCAVRCSYKVSVLRCGWLLLLCGT
jgi:hypothetical protein